MSLGDQGRMQIQRDVHCGVPGRDTWVKYCIKEGILETSGPEMKDASASVLLSNKTNRMYACMYIFKIIVFDSNIKRFATPTHMIGPRQSNNGCLLERQRIP